MRMGAGASAAPEVGVALNPRVQYATKKAQSEGKSHLIDAPALVNLPDGTVRYRYVGNQQSGQNNFPLSLHESPHTGGTDLEHKKGYFFHARMADYSTEANNSKPEAGHKFKYVYKGPLISKNKKLYYVTGKGISVSDHTASYSGSELMTPTLSKIRKENNHVYYDLEPLLADDTSETGSTDVIEEVTYNALSAAPILLTVNSQESIDDIKEKVSMHILKPTSQIHIFYRNHEIRQEENLARLVHETHKDQYKIKLIKQPN
ncbi:uncharacterized protein [Watersipora subatra]|uniref:uncharacterized protein n=1 Tax=Watersipora subatra TaxID=2589382 RepID=UPI00355B5B21